MRTWVTIGIAFAAGAAFGFLTSEKLNSDERIAELTNRVATLEAPQPAAPLPQRAAPPAERRITDVSIVGAPMRGAEDAPVTIVEFSDFQCPYCARAHPTMQRLLAAYPERVRLVFKHNPLPMHPESPLAHRASIAAYQQDHFWEMHDKIFENIRDLSRNTLIGYAQELDLDVSRFTRDLDSAEFIAQLDRDIAESARLSITGTPTFLINGKFVSGAQPFENFQALVERELALTGT